jgi:hypothetical protein
MHAETPPWDIGRPQPETQAAEWEWTHPVLADPEVFRREILPLLQGVPLGTLVKAAGLSLRYCSLIRRGEEGAA